MTDWHAPDDLVTGYADGSLPETDAWSLEKHLETCTTCAGRVSRAIREGAAGVVLAEVRGAVLGAAPGALPAVVAAGMRAAPGDLPAVIAAGRGAARGGARPKQSGTLRAQAGDTAVTPAPAPGAVARRPGASAVAARLGRILWAAGPALRGAWTGAVLLVALGALTLAYGGGFDAARPLLLAVAPIVPVAGVALSYGRHADPLHEIAAASPSGGLRLVLTRTAAVLALSVPLLTLAGLLLPPTAPQLPDAPAAAAWLLPGLALTLATLALSGYVGCRTASAVIGGGWLLALVAPVLTATGPVLTARLTHQLSLYFTGASPQRAWAAASALCALLLAARRSAYDRLETM